MAPSIVERQLLNDFKLNLKGLKGVLKKLNVKYGKDEDRHVTIVSGPGCEPDDDVVRSSAHFGHGRSIEAKTKDGKIETINSYDFEYVITKDGKKVYPTKEEFTEVDIAGETTSSEEKKIVPTKGIKRKRG